MKHDYNFMLEKLIVHSLTIFWLLSYNSCKVNIDHDEDCLRRARFIYKRIQIQTEQYIDIQFDL